MPQELPAPQISVLMPAYNAQAFIRQSVQSVLAQTFEDFELLVVNDGSTDATREILAAFDDPRLRIIDNPGNCGVVASRNRAMAEARGRYIAINDADDISLPQRFARQHALLEADGSMVASCARESVLEQGEVKFVRPPADQDPLVVRAMLHFSNPVGHSSVMFRASAVAAMGEYQREAFIFAEDFDFLHRLTEIGGISEIPDYLVIYRRHATNLSSMRRSSMLERTAAVLREAFVRLLGEPCAADAERVANHMLAQSPFVARDQMVRVGRFLDRLIAACADRYDLTDAQRARVSAHAGRQWWAVVQSSLRAGELVTPLRFSDAFSSAAASRPRLRQLVRTALVGVATRYLRIVRPDTRAPSRQFERLTISGVPFCAEQPDRDAPPSLYVVVDTEAAFDRSKGVDRAPPAASAMPQQHRAQTLFEAWGVRPIYVVDYPTASQPDGYGPLREMLARHACVIGAHLHAWVTPPFEETVSAHNSRGGNLPRDLEARKLRTLVAAIERNFGVAPLFFRAGHYGVGPNTMELVAQLGIQVDLSLLPHADLRSRGGPDFRCVESVPYRVVGERLLSVPMTRGQVGTLAPLSPRLQGLLHHPLSERLRLPGMLAQLNLAKTVTLTPEGVTSDEQIRLIDAMMARGCRTFVLHYHSTSWARQTPHVRNEADLAEFIGRIERVCRHFFDVRGGLPGNPADLLPPGQRSQVWPAPPTLGERGDVSPEQEGSMFFLKKRTKKPFIRMGRTRNPRPTQMNKGLFASFLQKKKILSLACRNHPIAGRERGGGIGPGIHGQ